MSGNTSQKSNSLLDAIDHLNKGGTKYFHMNDGSYPSVESQNRENGDASASGRFSLAIGRLANATAENAIAIGTDSAATATQAIAIGHQAQAKAENGLVLGTNALVTAISGVALGEGSVAMRAGMKGQTVTTAEFNINTSKAVYAPSSASAESQAAVVATASNSVGAVSVGSDKITRQITNVAAGSADSDAVNVAQL